MPGIWESTGDNPNPVPKIFFSNDHQSRLTELCQATLNAQHITQSLLFITASTDLSDSQLLPIWPLSPPNSADAVHPYNKIITFGDSLTDTGNRYNRFHGIAPNRQSWFVGHFTNGLTWIQQFVANIQLQNPELALLDWSFGGANTQSHAGAPSLIEQIDSWLKYCSRSHDPNFKPENALVIIFIGNNDLLFNNSSPKTAVATIKNAADKLINNGIRHIAIYNLPDVSRTPLAQRERDPNKLHGEIIDFNDTLDKTLTGLRQQYPTVNFILFDSYTLFNTIMEQYKTPPKDNTTTCLEINPKVKYSDLMFLEHYTVRPECIKDQQTTTNHVFWDLFHPTDEVHARFAQALARTIQQSDPIIATKMGIH